MIQPRDTFLENLQLIEDADRFLVCKGKESFDLSGVPHEKDLHTQTITRPMEVIRHC